jgi:hypothetical protein
VDETVVGSAKKSEVLQVGWSSSSPVDYVVGITPLVGAKASRVLAVAVPEDEGSADGGGNHPGAAAYVERLTFRVDDDPRDVGVAGPSLG